METAPPISHRRTFVEDHRWLLRVFGAARLGPVLAFAAGLAAALVRVGWKLVPDRDPALLLVYIPGGIVYWSFLEYAIHRWFYHWTPRARGLRRLVESFHVYHHRNPEDRAVWNAGPALVVALTAALAVPPLAAFRDVGATAWFLAGSVLAYAVYEVFHHEVHARPHARGPFATMQRFHRRHHERNWKKNFSVTTPFWDWVFGTLAPDED
jgi:sterol desaturase/sphingolipid hydroxylase (fatty acid hydroxylase superfamily)